MASFKNRDKTSASDITAANKPARKPHPAAARKAAAVEAYTKEFGRAPTGRNSAADLERRVKSLEFSRARSNAMAAAMDRPSAAARTAAPAPRPSSTMTMPSRMPSSSPPPASRFPQWGGGNDLHDLHGSSGGRGLVTKGLLGVGVGAAAVQGYMAARDRGDDVGTAAAKGALNAAPQAFVAAAPQIQRGAATFAEGAFALSKHLADQTGLMDFVFLDAMFAKGAMATGALGLAAKGVEKVAKVAGRFALPASLAVGAAMGAMKDENVIRGAGRGMVSALDPTALFMKKGVAERLYDSAFGEGDRPIGQQPVMNRENPRTDTHRGSGAIKRHSSLPAPQHFAAANEAFRSKQQADAAKAPAQEGNGNHLRGFQNPNNLIAAIKAKGGDASRIAPA